MSSNPFSPDNNSISQGFLTNTNTDITQNNPFGNVVNANINDDIYSKVNADKQPTNFLSSILDLFSRGQYASAALVDTVAQKGIGSLGTALYNAGNELIDPKARLSFSDVIKRYDPQFAQDHPWATTALGFVGDVALDPTTYLGIGLAGTGKKIAGKVLTAEGEGLFKKILADETLNVAKQLGPQSAQELLQVGTRKFLDSSSQIIARENAEKILGDVFSNTDLLAKYAPDVKDTTEALQKFTKADGLRIFVGNKEFGQPLFDKLGVNSLFDKLGQIKDGFNILGVVNRNQGLPEEYVQLRKAFENSVSRIADDTVDNTRTLFKGLSKESREKIGKAGLLIDAQLRDFNLGEDINTILPDVVGNLDNLAGVNSTLFKEQYADKVRDTFQKLGFTDEEKAAYVRMVQNLKDVQNTELKLDIFKDQVNNFDQGVYDLIKDPSKFLQFRELQKGEQLTDLSSKVIPELLDAGGSENLKALFENAAKKGYVPELDAGLLYAQRIATNQKVVNQGLFDDALKQIFNVTSKTELPNRVKEDLALLGEGTYGQNTTEAAKAALGAYDKVLGLFKAGSTVAKPSFAPKQLIQNTIQGFIANGVSTFKVFDPRSVLDAALLTIDHATGQQILPEFVRSYVENHFDKSIAGQAVDLIANRNNSDALSQGLKLTTALGETYTGKDLLELMKSNGILKGSDIRGDVLSRDLASEVLKATNGDQGWTNAALNASKFWQWGSKVEDFSRASMFLNGIRMGYSPSQAAEMTTKALFDMQGSLSGIEKDVIKRVIPFYAYQRNAVPLILETALNAPGRIATTYKGQQAFTQVYSKLFTGDNLSEAERRILPDYLLSQPSSFTGFQKDAMGNNKAVFNVFNSFTPLDSIALAEYNDKGQLDVGNTIKKVILGQITPFLKMPLEIAIDKNLFTDRNISNSQRVDGVYNYIDKLPKAFQDAIDYEYVTDPRTGEKKAYVNPYIAYTLANTVPQLNTIVRLTKDGNTPLEKAMDLFFGVGTRKVDLQSSYKYKLLDQQKSIEQQKQLIRYYQIHGEVDHATDAQKDLMDLLSTISNERAAMSGPIR